MLYTVTGPSGSGKTTLVREIIKKFPDKFERIITVTDRRKRKNEIEGVDYIFKNKKDMTPEYMDRNLLAVTEFDGHHYGIPIVPTRLIEKKDGLVIVDKAGAYYLRRRFSWVRNIYIQISEERAKAHLSWRHARYNLRQKADKEAGLYLSLDDKYDCILVNNGSLGSLMDNFYNYTVAQKELENQKYEKKNSYEAK